MRIPRVEVMSIFSPSSSAPKLYFLFIATRLSSVDENKLFCTCWSHFVVVEETVLSPVVRSAMLQWCSALSPAAAFTLT